MRKTTKWVTLEERKKNYESNLIEIKRAATKKLKIKSERYNRKEKEKN